MGAPSSSSLGSGATDPSSGSGATLRSFSRGLLAKMSCAEEGQGGEKELRAARLSGSPDEDAWARAANMEEPHRGLMAEMPCAGEGWGWLGGGETA